MSGQIIIAKLKPYLKLLPVLFVVVFLFGGGLVLGLVRSLGYQPLLGKTHLTLKFYSQVLKNPDFLVNFKYTLFIASISTLLSTIIGVLLAMLLVVKAREWQNLRLLYKLPMMVPHMVAAFMITDFLNQGGLIARLLFHLGLIERMEQFPILVYDRYGLGIILVYLWKEIPFITLMVFSVMEKINTHFWDAAANLGASSIQIWTKIILPLSWPSIISAAIIVFAFTFGAFEIPYLVGSIYPTTLSVWAFKSHINADLYRRPESLAISMIIAFISMISVWIYLKFSNAYLDEKILHQNRQNQEGGRGC
ncbi:hypothetical protein BBF96_01275 [Anoxybacter fermentans]|uniref:ABC transmembrane type-1 domain-containing protein n=1 Tax=Anoxybacter fermentans TaxID=1323375 RepID=A0A3S9SV46_9FIRM|nr:ABC transporter permease subunit [Anoxybacter fermentans]AZR72144.1 hypothetical protein BBF96_01275 [Anoxybacter fermentans]